MDDVTVVCDVCDEEIRIRKYEDTNSAYARHSQTAYHLEVEETFRSIKANGNNSSPEESASSTTDEPSMPANVPDVAKSCVFSCKLCQVEIVDSLAMMSHMQSEKHAKMENFVTNVNVQRETLQQVGFSLKQTFPDESKEILACFSNMNSEGVRICLVCFTRVPSDEFHLLGHVNFFEMHKNMLNAMFTYKGLDRSFHCIICDVFDSGEEEYKEHCSCDQHRSSIDVLCKFMAESLL